MSSRLRRFEVLLPLQFNDSRDVPSEWLAEAVLEIVDQFGAASYETQVVVDVPDSAKSRQWMRLFKSRWKIRLEQLELWMVSYRIEVE
jgi:hypothetical protein